MYIRQLVYACIDMNIEKVSGVRWMGTIWYCLVAVVSAICQKWRVIGHLVASPHRASFYIVENLHCIRVRMLYTYLKVWFFCFVFFLASCVMSAVFSSVRFRTSGVGTAMRQRYCVRDEECMIWRGVDIEFVIAATLDAITVILGDVEEVTDSFICFFIGSIQKLSHFYFYTNETKLAPHPFHLIQRPLSSLDTLRIM